MPSTFGNTGSIIFLILKKPERESIQFPTAGLLSNRPVFFSFTLFKE